MPRSLTAAVLAATLSVCTHAAADEPALTPDDLVGTFQVRAKLKDGRRTTGKLVIKPRQTGGLDLSGDLPEVGAFHTTAKADARRFDLDVPATPDTEAAAKGAARRLELIDPWEEETQAKIAQTHRFLTLSALPGDPGRYFQGTLTLNGATLAHLKLQRRNRVLVVHAKGWSTAEQNTFSGYAKKVERYYANTRGWDTTRVEVGSWDDVIAAVSVGWSEGHRFNRFVSVSHSGWDGPLLSGQISSRSTYDKDRWTALIQTFKQGLSPNAKAYISGCHAGGSNRYELADYGDYRWVVAVGKASGRTFAGPAGNTSTVNALTHTQATLEGIGKVRQEVWIGGPSGTRRIGPGGTLGSAKAVEPSTK